ncbi:YbaB/EbfC family nucleoid-associated protein [Microlunatus soli]|uniref:Nucleoid-associated protein SAMN04489812_2254 n=1 Tax=Microlunatus soli TaxID=630515 RepID=A0A1H1T6J1_9ACTN|nr:DNA-binding protein, YbaB/EbfC family [Microlunatus soli]
MSEPNSPNPNSPNPDPGTPSDPASPADPRGSSGIPGLGDLEGLGGMGGAPGGMDLGGMLAQAQAMQQQLMQAQEELAATTFEGRSGGDLVIAKVSGAGELLDLTIKPEAADPDDTETLADLVLAAVRAATEEQQQAAAAKLGPMAGGLGL